MPLLKTILHYAGFGKKDKMSNPDEFQPTDIFHHRYQDPQVLIEYVKTLPDIKKDQIKVKVRGPRFALDVRSRLTCRTELERWPPWAESVQKARKGGLCAGAASFPSCHGTDL